MKLFKLEALSLSFFLNEKEIPKESLWDNK